MIMPAPGYGRLTPEQVRTVTFTASRLARRGLDEEQVRAFCGQVERELVRLLSENTAMYEEVQRLRRRILSGGGGRPEDGVLPEDARVQAVRLLAQAQRTADTYIAEAQEYCRELTEDARRHSDEILGEARQRAAMVVGEAHSKARSAADTAARSDPVALAGPAGGGTDAGLQSETAFLRMFSEVCRTHLRTYLEALLANVEDWEQAEKNSLAAMRAELTALAKASPE